MSKAAVDEFFKKIRTDEKTRSRFGAIQAGLVEKTMAELSEKLVALGVESGFDVTMEDLRDIYRTMVEQANASRELTEGELDAAVGGGADVVALVEVVLGGIFPRAL